MGLVLKEQDIKHFDDEQRRSQNLSSSYHCIITINPEILDKW